MSNPSREERGRQFIPTDTNSHSPFVIRSHYSKMYVWVMMGSKPIPSGRRQNRENYAANEKESSRYNTSSSQPSLSQSVVSGIS